MAVTIHPGYAAFLKDVDRGRVPGSRPFIMNPLNRVEHTFNLTRDKFILLGSNSGVGKSSYIDDLIVMKPWRSYVRHHPESRWEVIYYSMERKKKFKYGKWLSWLLYADTGYMISANDILGYGSKGVILQKAYDIIRSYDEEVTELLDHVHIYDGRTTVERVKTQLLRKATELGTLFTTDSIGLKKQGKGNYIAMFSKDKVRQTSLGPEMYVEFTFKGETYSLTQDDHRYFLNNPDTFVFVVLDGVGLIDTTEFGGNTKRAVDEITNVLADARDIYGFSPVMVSQFNRGMADVQRAKLHGSNQGPQESDFKDSGNTFNAADLVIGLFDPYRQKAYDNQGYYGGYDISSGMMSPKGFSRFRSMHILKNTFGPEGGVFGMKYVGECSYFETLPKADSEAIHNIYAEIAAGK